MATWFKLSDEGTQVTIGDPVVLLLILLIGCECRGSMMVTCEDMWDGQPAAVKPQAGDTTKIDALNLRIGWVLRRAYQLLGDSYHG